jgi:hypothetical protein
LLSAPHVLPVNPLEERMLLDLFGIGGASAKAETGVAVQEFYNEVKSRLRHIAWDVQYALLDIFEQLVPTLVIRAFYLLLLK